MNEYPFAPYLINPNQDQFTRITRIGYVLFTWTTYYGTILNCLGFTHCRVNLYSFSFAKFFKISSKFCSFVNPNFFGMVLFCNDGQKCTNSFPVTFFFFHFASTVLSNRSWRTRRYFTPLLSLASLSTYAKSIHQILFLNLANAFIRLNLRVARVKFL